MALPKVNKFKKNTPLINLFIHPIYNHIPITFLFISYYVPNYFLSKFVYYDFFFLLNILSLISSTILIIVILLWYLRFFFFVGGCIIRNFDILYWQCTDKMLHSVYLMSSCSEVFVFKPRFFKYFLFKKYCYFLYVFF